MLNPVMTASLSLGSAYCQTMLAHVFRLLNPITVSLHHDHARALLGKEERPPGLLLIPAVACVVLLSEELAFESLNCVNHWLFLVNQNVDCFGPRALIPW